MNAKMGQDIIVAQYQPLITALILPDIVSRSGAAGRFVWDEFFSGQLRNRHTRAAYLHAVQRFLKWVETTEQDLARITPGLIGRYFDQLDISIPSKKLHLSGLRRFFDLLVQRHVIALNPAHSVRTERYQAVEGKTPEITTEQARKLLKSIELKMIGDFRDKAVIATLIFTAARAGAIARLRVRDLMDEGGAYSLKFHEKGGKQRSIPVRHDLQGLLLQYLELVDPQRANKDAPLFRTLKPNGILSDNPLSGIDICRMIKRRLVLADLPPQISPHSFRSCAATDLLTQGVPLEDVQYLLGHSDVRVTRLYDRRQRRVTRNIVERISV
jgi:integrase/recombinase XerD